jgi:gluconokinase
MQQYIIGIDIGTGSTKAVAISLNGEVISSIQHYYPVYNPEQGASEQDPELIWQAFAYCILGVVAELGCPPQMVSLSSAMHSLIAVDENCRALMPMLTWADTRSESIATGIRNSALGEELYRATGTPIHPMSPLCKLIWLRKERAGLFNIAHKFISIKEYIWYRLFRSFQVDFSIASATGLFDIINLRWSNEAINLAGITLAQLSEPVNTNYVRQDMEAGIAQLLMLPPGTRFMIGASDGCCANLGSDVTKAGTAALTIGTSGAVRITGARPLYNFNTMIFNYLLNENTFVSGGAVNNGGNVVKWLLTNFLNISQPAATDYERLFDAVKGIPAGSNGLLFIPYIHGERAPVWDAKGSGTFLNIRPHHGKNHFLRAAVEGVCFALNDVLKGVEEMSVPVTQIHISGGFITSPVWVQILADVTGKQLRTVQEDDASALGAAYLAVKTMMPGKNVAFFDQQQQVIEPDAANHQLYAETFKLYKTVYTNLKASMSLLYDLS